MRHGSNFQSARLVKLLEVTVRDGTGTDDDPVRHVVHYVDEAGAVVAVRDGWKDENDHPDSWPEMGMEAARCDNCGRWLQIVRPGKYQCDCDLAALADLERGE